LIMLLMQSSIVLTHLKDAVMMDIFKDNSYDFSIISSSKIS